jgi:anaerobic nitric oxide reductase transcription regulator
LPPFDPCFRRISEVNLSAPEFPNITPSKLGDTAGDETYTPDLAAIREDLRIMGDAPAFVTALERVARLSGYDEHILLLGETGTGKEEFARLIHRLSRRSGPFVAVNCAAIPDALAESVLFGHKKGTFTGAQFDQDGEFVNADGGTLFLDEVGDMPMDIQAKLLRVLQDGQVRPIGAKSPRKTNVRVVAATNANLQTAIREGKFRADLAQRFIDTVEMPPLRERRGDIVTLALFALQGWNTRYGNEKKLSRESLAAMQGYRWPGNVRELISTVKRAAMLSRGKRILPEDLRLGEASWLEGQSAAVPLPEPHEGFDITAYFSEQREKLFTRALEIANGNQAKAATLLGVSPQAVHKFKVAQD